MPPPGDRPSDEPVSDAAARRPDARLPGHDRRPPPSPARTVDGDLLHRHGRLPDPRARPRDRRPALLRRPGLDQRVHGRVPDPEPRPLARRRRGALVGVRPGLQRAAREAREGPSVAGRLDAPAARPDGPRRADRALHPARALAHAAVRLRGRAGGPRRRALARPLPDRRAARAHRDRRRHPQLVRALHGAGDRAGLLEPRDHLRARDRRPAGGHRVGRALRLRGVRRRRDDRPAAPAAPLALAPGRPALVLVRLARPGDPPLPRR